MPHPSFIMDNTQDGQFHFNLTARNGEIILTSESYTTKGACENGVESVKTNAPDEARFDRNVASNGQFYFNLKATNGEIIGTSEMYTTEAARDNGIESVMTNAPVADIQDNT